MRAKILFYENPLEPDDDYLKIISGEETPRNTTDIDYMSNLIQRTQTIGVPDDLSKFIEDYFHGTRIASNRNEVLYNETGLFEWFSLSRQEFLTSYGARSVNAHFLNLSEIEPEDRVGSYVYNSLLTSYRVAQSLFSPTTASLVSYLDWQVLGYEVPHGTLHRYTQGIFLDGDFSVSSLLFFPFHSWIDAMLEFGLRRNQGDAEKLK